MIKKRFDCGTSTFFNPVLKKDVPIKLYIVAYDVAPEDWTPVVDPKAWPPKINPKTGEVPSGVTPQTIGQLKQRWGDGFQATLQHVSDRDHRPFQFDFSPWAHLPDETYLEISWRFEELEPKYPVRNL
jgi:hypothetical protein